jgi:hypothetical protein
LSLKTWIVAQWEALTNHGFIAEKDYYDALSKADSAACNANARRPSDSNGSFDPQFNELGK